MPGFRWYVRSSYSGLGEALVCGGAVSQKANSCVSQLEREESVVRTFFVNDLYSWRGRRGEWGADAPSSLALTCDCDRAASQAS